MKLLETILRSRRLERRRKEQEFQRLRDDLFERQMIAQDKLGLKWVAAKGSEFVVKGWTPRVIYDLPVLSAAELSATHDVVFDHLNFTKPSGGTPRPKAPQSSTLKLVRK